MTRFIFITGGVVSSSARAWLGRGTRRAAAGARLFKVRLRKLDPYLNVDPGTMSPYQHGEVYVTDDGAETDLDLGHYERFTGVPGARQRQRHHRHASTRRVIARERHGDYLGATVQVIPHVTDAIKEFIRATSSDADFVLCEIGGTVGDIEGLPFLEAIRQLGNELGRERGRLRPSDAGARISPRQASSRPSPPSIRCKELRGIGIQPDHPALPLRAPDPARGAAQDRAVLQRRSPAA